MEEKRFNVVIIGGGPGGYVAAIKAGQLGLNVLLIEKQKLGGICLNVGCIPSKALITASKEYERIKTLETVGIKAVVEPVNWKVLQEWKSGVVNKLVNGVGQLCRGNGVQVMYGEAELAGSKELIIKQKDGNIKVLFDKLVIATGSYPIELKALPYDHEFIWDSTDALNSETIPKSMVVVGGGYVGLELGSVFARFGCKVTIVEMLSQVLPGFDIDVVRLIDRKLRKLGIESKVNSVITSIERKSDGIVATVNTKGVESSIEVEKILVSVGRKPLTNGYGLERSGVALDEKGFIKVDNQLRTNADGIYAIGDVAGMPMLAHKASKEGETVAEVLAGKNSVVDYRCVPAVVFTEPEIAVVGITEQQATEQNIDTIIGKFPFAASGRAMALQETDGFVKIIGDKATHELLGVTIIGPSASDLISEAALAIEMGAAVEDIALTIHPHPTLGETLMEAAKVAIGEPIHIMKQKG
ncbi:MAG: dihydrolipoyl dehydrogenase [Candidatus Fischerbacteria bacterium RBG_13_37_8]|uniref:Dihydrolipoyl dehydrogenase n=1 Tax=Candidatus Fischerbacteria bacterium RBG_13_37_8 TaxID=1817863 RepID=A0A1F5VVS6_9BACT|nr:MAG: dihydrolipoyl dehydrogenase [Candidatus Fischerbacteria bacterium RBG_13_37_8]